MSIPDVLARVQKVRVGGRVTTVIRKAYVEQMIDDSFASSQMDYEIPPKYL